jgi:hypothetical protein
MPWLGPVRGRATRARERDVKGAHGEREREAGAEGRAPDSPGLVCESDYGPLGGRELQKTTARRRDDLHGWMVRPPAAPVIAATRESLSRR